MNQDIDKMNDKQIKENSNISLVRKNLVVKSKDWALEGCMKTLLADGCNPNFIDNNGDTIMIKAIKENKMKSMKLLLKNDCKTNLKNNHSMSPIG